MITATSTDVDWRTAAAAITAGSETPVAVVIVGTTTPDPLQGRVAGLVLVDELSLEDARDLVVAVVKAYPLVLVAAPAGPLVPVGGDGWNLADLTAALGAGALVVTGPGPDSVNHTTLMLGALAGHGISASVITVGATAALAPADAGAGPGGLDETKLPVTPIGRIPADPPADFAGAAAWFDPTLFAAPDPPPVLATDRTVSGKKFVSLLIAVFAVFIAMVILACGAAWWG
ncbi:hypothetical protein Acy02nite_49610 [Actinoplanes cyaneus]|uniref:Uncharacterized protein n=1 Tax=Actinoplanes cyaneus TaxID=52696 RepID=A0A919IJA4_9ACTN|nr:hypothetical protein [Actinoplanes cyaneus]MCW2141019.1 hypothetical protein [Actinoplanes cyaneus]GID67080.1 hypothetical protein Acy02nite_49610 [Actinoplanes cyaneus]